jgi:transposase
MNIVEPPNPKATLQIDLLGKSRKLPNTTPGHRAILGMLPENAFIIMESTGSYHIAAQESFQAAGIPVAIVNPVRVKQFGKARCTLAKTNPVDAGLFMRQRQRKTRGQTLYSGRPTPYQAGALSRRAEHREISCHPQTRLQGASSACRPKCEH